MGEVTRASSFAAVDDELLDVPWLKRPFEKIRTLGEACHGNKVLLVKNTSSEGPESIAVKVIKKASLPQAALSNPKTAIRAALWLRQNPLPGMMHVFGVWQDEDRFYLVSECFGDCDLFDSLRHLSDEGTKHRIARQMLHTVSELHAQGAAHLNLSLENWLVNGDGDVRLIGFGQAVILPEIDCISHVDERGPCGVPTYRAPELMDIVAERRENVYNPAKVDVFQVGVAMFILFVGAPPFNLSRESNLETAWLFPAAARNDGRCTRLRPLLQHWGKTIPDGCCDLLELLMAPNPNLRPRAAEALEHEWIAGAVDVLTSGGETQLVDAVRLIPGGETRIVDDVRETPDGET